MKSKCQVLHLIYILKKRFRHLYKRIRWLIRRRPRAKVVIRRFRKPNSKSRRTSTTRTSGEFSGGDDDVERHVRIATFNVAMFSLAPAISKVEKSVVFVHEGDDMDNYLKIGTDQPKSVHNHPKSILKYSPLHQMVNNFENLSQQTSSNKSRHKGSVDLPENEISLSHNLSTLAPMMRSPVCFPAGMFNFMLDSEDDLRKSRSILDVLREVDADILALQDVKADEEKNMKPLSDLARALGMNYVFAESWAPEYGNAILSKWAIKRWRVQKIYDDQDFRNVLRATIDVPRIGELNFLCTQLDHLDENWRMKQITAMMQSNFDGPHILAGGLNSLDGSDYSLQRWADIVKYHEQIGKPTPRTQVMRFLNGNGYIDSKDFSGQSEPVVMIAKGQNVQGTCKYGTRVDYVMASPDLPYKFVPGSYSVISSKGTSDHHLVKVDIVKSDEIRQHKSKQNIVRISDSRSSRGIWKIAG